MTKTAKQAIMDYFGVTLVPESLLKELEVIMLDVIGEDEKSVGGYDIPGDRVNILRSEQRQALQTALYGKDEK